MTGSEIQPLRARHEKLAQLEVLTFLERTPGGSEIAQGILRLQAHGGHPLRDAREALRSILLLKTDAQLDAEGEWTPGGQRSAPLSPEFRKALRDQAIRDYLSVVRACIAEAG
jgi:hypothetical protein